MLIALPFGAAYAADGNYLTLIILNVIIGLAMFLTPFIVNMLVGNSFSAIMTSLGPIAASTLMTGPAKAAGVLQFGREMLNHTSGFAANSAQRISAFQRPLNLSHASPQPAKDTDGQQSKQESPVPPPPKQN